MARIEISSRFQGPPTMAHGGYLAGLLSERVGGAVQVTLRKPTPLDRALELVVDESGARVLDRDAVLAEAVPASLSLDLPVPPTLEQAQAAEAGSPSYRGERGVHPTCFGCAKGRAPGDALRVLAGPCEVAGQRMVAARWVAGPTFADERGFVHPRFALAALDCAGAFAFIAEQQRAGLLGRIVLEPLCPVRADEELIVIGWQLGRDGRKLFAGTALFRADGTPCAAAKATWFS